VSVLASVRAALGEDASWRAQAALALAAQVDESGSASAARELRAVMDAIETGKPVEAGDAVDQLAARRKERRGA
jgi:hypothetical protein